LSGAVEYLGSLVGIGSQSAGRNLLAGVMYSRYHLLTLSVAAIVVWGTPPVWAYTQRLTPVRAGVCLGLLLLSIVLMWTQTENPFLYFQF
jgi:hypothetical protein